MSSFRFSTEQASYFYQEIHEILFDEHSAQSSQILFLRSILGEILQTLTAEEPQLFTDLYSRLLFVADKYTLPAYISRELHAFRRIAARAGRKNAKLTAEASHSAARALALVIFFFSEARAPEPLRTALLAAKPFTKEAATTKEILPLLRLTVQGFGIVENKQGRAFVDIEGLSHDGETLLVRCWEPWHDLEQLGWNFCTLHIAQVRFVGLQKLSTTLPGEDEKSSANTDTEESEISLYETTAQSIVILEPDYLLDITDLAECVQGKLPFGGNPRLSLLRKFMPTEAKMSLVGGNIANFCFDALLSNPEADFDSVFKEAILQKPLQIIVLQHENMESLNLLRMHASTVFDNIRTMLITLAWDKASIEASFMSPMYGLQGRLDLMVEYADDPRRKTIVELKSGTAPANATWENHAAQVTGYNLLLDSCFRERSGDSCIFYARDIVRPLRNIPNDRHAKQLLLALRNRIIAQEHALALRHQRTLQELHPDYFGLMPRFVETDLQRFALAFATASTLERKYFRAFAAFVSRENWSARIGGGGERGEGFSGLWRKSLAEKADKYSVLAHLALDSEQSDFAKLHLHFRRTSETSPLANFRVGDIVILYPLFADEADERSFLRGAMLKGYIKRLTRESVVVSLRNKQIVSDGRAEGLFRSEVQWAIEPDFMGTEFKSQYESLFELLKAPENKRNLLLGLQKPECDGEIRHRVQNTPYNDLTEEQHSRLAEAMSANDYFLLQGPPGTGKTSRMLKSMALHLHNHTSENVLFLAFTNRAVDEICEALKTASLDFIRLGTKDSTAHADRVLNTLIEGKTIKEITALLAGQRIIVSTISSLLKNQEILALKRFDTLIVDEASQVVEPQIIGLLARFRRFILIGDEKQLPAVVVQPERGAFVKDEEMNSVGIFDLRTSVFERLITRCKTQGWAQGFGIITRQGRMHRDVAAFPNSTFYGGALAHLSERQTEPLSQAPEPANLREEFLEIDSVKKTLSRQRLVFWASRQEEQTKVHEQEAKRAALLAMYFREQLGETFHAGSIGIITPFRAQIAAIHRHLAAELHGSITIDTVERYQGSERDIIILSFAVNFPSQLRSLQSLSADGTVDRKLNVALTRARERMIALGCAEALAHSPILNRFIGFVRDNGGFLSESE